MNEHLDFHASLEWPYDEFKNRWLTMERGIYKETMIKSPPFTTQSANEHSKIKYPMDVFTCEGLDLIFKTVRVLYRGGAIEDYILKILLT